MDPVAPRRPRAALAVTLAVAALAASLAGSLQAAAAAPARRHGGPAPAAAAPSLPADFPSARVPLPAGKLQGATGRAGQWSVLLLVRGSAARAHRTTVAFYKAHRFRARTDSILQRGRFRVTIVVENRDHSAAKTFVAIGVTRL